ncbi:MATE family efflux transporter [Flavobacterium sp. MAH-1]|uniref:Multidrug export protein MepA n=1 Tax=Flavobacterium agri TaxID=2743471 RepID=A0A7Y8Y0M3_9FLAO|nr:MATE family efflux transporter [Flavobacterium agri]NUY80196.1 MATE family efflux transporter [Flavobacterium agri]NYA70221.1 MATE family efflux transporter [Flavobacterium agri]
MEQAAEDFGTGDLKKLLLRQAVPASVGILFLTVNMLIDTILVGRWIGSIAIAALTVVTPIIFLMASVGFAIGVGGSSVLSRALGAKNIEKAKKSVAHQIVMTSVLTILLMLAGLLFTDWMLKLFGAQGDIVSPAKTFFYPVLLAGPLQALGAMGNSIMRAEDKARYAMIGMITPSVMNLVFDVAFIKFMDMGVFGAALATSLSFLMGFLYLLWYFIYKSDIKLEFRHFLPDWKLTGEIGALSFTTLARQSVISALSVLLNHQLFEHGGETSVTVYGIVSKMLMFALFPVNGIMQGFQSIAGFNFGAEKYGRVKEIVKISVWSASILAIVVYTLILIFAEPIAKLFIDDAQVIAQTPNALRWVFAASPVIAIQLIGSTYFQAEGKAVKSLLLTLTKQGFFLIPLILILPDKFGIFGIWVAFPIADVLATLVTGSFLFFAMKKLSDGKL